MYGAFVDSGDFCEDAAPLYRRMADSNVDVIVYAGTCVEINHRVRGTEVAIFASKLGRGDFSRSPLGP